MIASVPFAALAEAAGPVDGVEYVVWEGAEPPPRDDIELVVLDYRNARMTLDRLDELPAVAVVQTQTAGVDGIVELLPDGVLLANARGVHDDATAELALGLTLASLRGIDEAVRSHGHWATGRQYRSLADSNVAVLGYGSIGRALASRLLACRAVVTAVASAPRDDDLVGRVVTAADVDWAAQHVVVVVLPLTDATRHVVDARVPGAPVGRRPRRQRRPRSAARHLGRDRRGRSAAVRPGRDRPRATPRRPPALVGPRRPDHSARRRRHHRDAAPDGRPAP